jgi:ribose transport system ATP-binding protein
MMIGRELKDYYPPNDTIAEGSVLKVRDLSVHNKLYSINLEIRKGEILGVAGLEGQGQNELIRAIIGEIKRDVGEIYRNGENVKIESAFDAIRAGIGYIPDDRKQDGLILIRSVNENIALPSLKKRIQNLIFINNKKEKTFVNGLIEKLAIIITSRLQLVQNLSGGNQQKVVLAKWLGIKPEVLVVAEPTRGIDVGSKSEIHHMMRDLARQGVGILMVSSELPEILGMSDRIIVMAEGRIVAKMPWQQASEEVIMAAATKDIISEEISVDAFTRL